MGRERQGAGRKSSQSNKAVTNERMKKARAARQAQSREKKKIDMLIEKWNPFAKNRLKEAGANAAALIAWLNILGTRGMTHEQCAELMHISKPYFRTLTKQMWRNLKQRCPLTVHEED